MKTIFPECLYVIHGLCPLYLQVSFDGYKALGYRFLSLSILNTWLHFLHHKVLLSKNSDDNLMFFLYERTLLSWLPNFCLLVLEYSNFTGLHLSQSRSILSGMQCSPAVYGFNFAFDSRTFSELQCLVFILFVFFL